MDVVTQLAARQRFRAVVEQVTARIDLAHIPYNGPAAGIAAVASGEAQAMIVSVTTGIGAAQAGKVRALALFAAKRTPLLPDVPTAAEAGFGDVDLSAWIGLVAPAGTPSPIVERVNRELERVLREPASLAWADRQGLEIIGGSSASFAGTIDADRRRWAG
ncbi:MAG TPA: tripartite tricarboxylate transporter substrate-binding protein, partial [Accumulibacter sp.]|nr:tripartite tricarboxylate transporter substrate-binding protein [Accumulibacter sp.]